MAKRVTFFILVFTLLALPVAGDTVHLPLLIKHSTMGPAPVSYKVVISDLQYAGSDEYVAIYNVGLDAVSLAGWRLQSVVGNQWYAFPDDSSIAAGATLRVHSGPDALDAPPTDLVWGRMYIWNNDGDEARLYDDGNRLVDRQAYSTAE